MPLPSLHPLPANPTTGQQPLATLGGRGISGPPPTSAAGGGGGVNREVLKGLQDVAWSDDEDDPDCLLCAEPLDLSDLNFKPCQCGMQICQFCYNKLLGTDARCPGCRRPYDAKAVVFQPVDWDEVKRAKEKKTRRGKTIKQLSSMGRRHLLGVRVVMKNMVYVVGMKLPAAGDEVIPILRSNDYFGQYGKISKLYLRDRAATSSTTVPILTAEDPSTSTGIYIAYVRREDAARAILALEGIPAPQGPPGQVLRASYGTTRYCDAFLRGLKCDIANCNSLHEWGGESDCFTKDDMETAMTRPTEYDARQKQAQLLPMVAAQKTAWSKPSQAEDPAGSALPNSAGWGKSVGTGRIVNGRIVNGRISTPVAISRPAKVTNLVPLKNNSAFPLPIPSPITPVSAKLDKEKRKSASAAAMARGRSSDSTQSTTGSSAQTSPKRIPVALPIVAAATIAPAFPPIITPPPELRATSISDTSKGLDLASLSQPCDEPREESVSADSEAGPSSASPPPRTPARHTHEVPPPPLTSEPIVVHSPYEEPRIFAFPTSDPGFAFVLGLDDSEIQRQQAQAGGYQPSPFSKTLVGLAELGVLSPELPDTIALQPSHASPSFSSTFQPFDSDSEDETTGDVEVTAGPSRATGVTQQNVPRTSSRFDFARNTSFTASRGQSPFASMRRHVEDPSLPRDPWSGRQPLPSDALRSQQSGENRRSAMGSQASSFGSHGLGNENGWAVESPLMAQRQAGGFGRDERADGLRMEYGGMMGYTRGKGVRSDRDDFEPSMLHYGTNPSLHAQRAIFSPDGLLDDGPFHSFPQMNPQLHTPQGYPNSRAWQYQQQRAQSPSALTSHGYRRF